MSTHFSRRDMLCLTAQAAALGALAGAGCLTTAKKSTRQNPNGIIIGEANGAAAGMKVLADGGNAFDAVVAAALVSCIVTPARCGIGGYGGHATLALAGGKKVVSIDFNSTAPTAARADMYPLDEKGAVKGRVNFHGWLAAGVPGTLAGLQLLLDGYGSRPFRELVQPAVAIARDGAAVNAAFAQTLRGMTANLRRDPGMAKLYLRDNEPLKVGETFRNPELAAMLTTLAERNSVDSFYRGDIAQRIADGFQKNGGLVNAADLAAYRAREVEPLAWRWQDCLVHTAPLTAGGVTVLEALAILAALRWDALPAGVARTHAQLEALRLAWHDRLHFLGDPAKVNVPVEMLLSRDYTSDYAAKIDAAVKAKQPMQLEFQFPALDGTVNLSCADRFGNLIALTLTHGSGFGAQVAVDGLGLCLGHGMSRFNPRPDHPNSPGPGKRPLHNMCPTIVLRGGRLALALGGAGGVRIPNSIFDVLTHYVLLGEPMAAAVAAPRLHCTGGLDADVTSDWPVRDADYLREVGFNLKTGGSAFVSAVAIDSKTGNAQAAAR
jgi:gamma-glutamyltranspeptidase/glutathione hydrolase